MQCNIIQYHAMQFNEAQGSALQYQILEHIQQEFYSTGCNKTARMPCNKLAHGIVV